MTVGFAGRTWAPFVIALACAVAPNVASHAQRGDSARLPRALVPVPRDAARATDLPPYDVTVVDPDSARPRHRRRTIDELLPPLSGVTVAEDGMRRGAEGSGRVRGSGAD